MSRRQLREVGIDRFDVRNEVDAGRWHKLGRQTVVIGQLTECGRFWAALFETGQRAVLDGAAALVSAGLQNFVPQQIDVTIPWGSRSPRPIHPGTVVHQPRVVGETMTSRSGLPIVVPERAAIRGARWAASDRQAALLLCVAANQRLVATSKLQEQWGEMGRGTRTAFLDMLIGVVADGVHALGELDFAAECRRRALPEPTRQSIRQLPGRTAYLDAEFEDFGCAVEIDGSHHLEAAQALDDMLRQNDVVIGGIAVLRIPVLGFHLKRDAFMDQVERLLLARGWVRPS